MAPVPPTNVATTPTAESEDFGAAPGDKVATGGVPVATDHNAPVPTKVGAYRSRGIRSENGALGFVPVLLRILTAVFALIAFAVMASDSFSVVVGNLVDSTTTSVTVQFNDYFAFSYLLTVNVLAFVYALVTIFLALFLMSKNTVSSIFFIVIFALDQILAYLLMSASTSAATAIRVYNTLTYIPSSFLSKSYASIAFSFLAFFALAAAALFSGHRLLRRQ